MLKNYIKTTFRYLTENKIFSVVNLLGLSLALCLIYFTFLYVHFEWSYDRFNKQVDQIYRISTDVTGATGISKETAAAPLALALEKTFPEVEKAGRLLLDYYIISKDEDNFGEQPVAYADSSIFSIFSFPLLRGNPSTVFEAPFDLVISESAAKRYFGTTDCLNQTLMLDGKTKARVTGVMKDIPVNSHFRANMLLSMSSLFAYSNNSNANEDWNRFGFLTYICLKEHTDIQAFQTKLASFAEEMPTNNGVLKYKLLLEPLKTLYLQGSVRGNKTGTTTHGNYSHIYIFSFVALFILCIACFNYVNLTTALSLKRAKEIGIRQVLGASKKQLTVQFLLDSFILSSLAFFIALLLFAILFPWFNALSGKSIISTLSSSLRYFPFAFAISLLTGLLAGIYPAFFLSRLKPVSTLKGKFAHNGKGLVLRRSLVFTQFVVFIILGVATIVINRQLHFMRNDALGFKNTHNLVIDYHYDERINEHLDQIQQELSAISGVESTCYSAYIPGRANRQFPTSIEGQEGNQETFQSDVYFIDDQFMRVYGLNISAGRGFSKTFPHDIQNSMVINEACLKRLGYTDPKAAIGKKFSQTGHTGEIIGVVKDFPFHSLHEEISPLTLRISPGFFTFLTLSLSSAHLSETIKILKAKWQDLVPGLPLVYYFTDETFNSQYQAEERFGKLFISFSGCAIFISCLGLLGLVSFNTLQRTKEIGVRKVLGANQGQLFFTLTKEYVYIVMFAFLFAIPISVYLMHFWLNTFAYRIQLQWWMFLPVGLAAIGTAFLTITFLALKAALANPVKSLRNE